jgi:ATP-dependent exoDNAse (exonuclease V) beta subunit
MKTFIKHDLPKLKRIDGGASRLYETPDGKQYPSVTSVLGFKSEESIQKWRDKVGAEEADRISRRASSRGTRIHTLCEDYLTEGNASPDMFDAEMFTSIKPYLDKIDNIQALETPLYSDYLKVAGTVDCIAEYDGNLSIIDFKTSSRIKSKEDIPSYFMQCSAYAVAFEELTKIPVGRLVIIMAVDNENPIIFKEKRDNWIGEFIKLREEYRKCKNL